MSSLCQACVPLCTIFLSGSCEVNYSLFPTLCQVLVRLLTTLSGSALVRLMLGLCLVQMSGLIQALVCQARHFSHMLPIIIILNDNHFRVQPSQKIRGNYLLTIIIKSRGKSIHLRPCDCDAKNVKAKVQNSE